MVRAFSITQQTGILGAIQPMNLSGLLVIASIVRLRFL
jgi:hypothetical protein